MVLIESIVSFNWYTRRDSNPHARRYWSENPAALSILHTGIWILVLGVELNHEGELPDTAHDTVLYRS